MTLQRCFTFKHRVDSETPKKKATDQNTHALYAWSNVSLYHFQCRNVTGPFLFSRFECYKRCVWYWQAWPLVIRSTQAARYRFWPYDLRARGRFPTPRNKAKVISKSHLSGQSKVWTVMIDSFKCITGETVKSDLKQGRHRRRSRATWVRHGLSC